MNPLTENEKKGKDIMFNAILGTLDLLEKAYQDFADTAGAKAVPLEVIKTMHKMAKDGWLAGSLHYMGKQ